jgi:membrane protein DedA with SNARE-associated domain
MHMLADGPPPHLPGFLNSLAGPLDHFGYWAVLVFVMIEDFGVPVPGETILIAAAVYAGAGRLNVLAVGVIGFVAAVVGDNIGFAIGHYGGRTVVLRWGRYVRLTQERLDKAEIFFQRHGAWIITVARFIEGLRQANGIVAGTAGLRWRRFLAFNTLGAALWAGAWVSLGYGQAARHARHGLGRALTSSAADDTAPAPEAYKSALTTCGSTQSHPGGNRPRRQRSHRLIHTRALRKAGGWMGSRSWLSVLLLMPDWTTRRRAGPSR